MPRPAKVTLPDLVVLSLLTEQAMHGYELWAELERRQVEKWASITKAQVYYSLRKLENAGHVVPARDGDEALRPRSRVYKPSADGRRVLSSELAHAKWATQRPPDPFLTWMVLSWQARPRGFNAQIARGGEEVDKEPREKR